MKYILILLTGISILTISCNNKSTKEVKEEKPPFDAWAKTIKSDSTELDSLSYAVEPQDSELKIPKELKSLIIKGYIPYSLEQGDINADGLKDYILTIGKPLPKDENGDLDYEKIEENEEKLNVLLIIRNKNNKFSLTASNKNIINYPVSTLHEPDTIYPDSTGTGFYLNCFAAGEGVHSTYTRETFYFTFSKKDNQWYLSKIIEETGLNRPGAALFADKEDFIEQHPNYTESQLDSIDKDFYSYEDPKFTPYTSKDFIKKIAFPSFNIDEYNSGESIINRK